jgi:ATP-dependent Lon protease
VTVIRSRFTELGIDLKAYKELDTHFHVPEGAIKKDGPSAGVAMCVVLVSSLTQIPVRADVAMTGEITLRGEVLPIGGLKEKLLAALRGGIKLVIIPEENKAELSEIPDKIKKGLDIRPVRWIDEVFALALEKPPRAKKTIRTVAHKKK